MLFFNPRGRWNPPWLFLAFSRVDHLASSELGDLHKHVQDWYLKNSFFRTTLIRYWSPEEYSGFNRSLGLPHNTVLLNLRGSQNPSLSSSNFAVTGLLPCGLSRSDGFGWFIPTCSGLSFLKVFYRTTVIRYQSPRGILWPCLFTGSPGFLLIWYQVFSIELLK